MSETAGVKVDIHGLDEEQRRAVMEDPRVYHASKLYGELWRTNHPLQDRASAMFIDLATDKANELGYFNPTRNS